MGEKRTLHSVMASSGPQRRDLEARKRILASTLKLLKKEGYANLTIGEVATDAKVGKATLYRSWPSKAELVLDAVRTRLKDVPVDETGNSTDEVLAVARQALADFFCSPEVQVILPALIADTARNPELAQRLREDIIEPRRARARTVLERAIERGDLAAGTDIPMLLEMWAGAMMFRSVFYDGAFDDDAIERMVTATMSSPPRLPEA
ncbi:TetR/AcrR family transcriptional regulator [Streptomyces sp. NPDC004327]|uniref:TetR/AcrR family transcriptional regulator n=1 Tax=unclassified Streptomyces TaxID=2593676 RepID=UPI0036B48C0F